MFVVFALILNVVNPKSSAEVPSASVASVSGGETD